MTCIKNNFIIGFACKDELVGINQIRNEVSFNTSNDYILSNLEEDDIAKSQNQETLVATFEKQLIGFIRYYRCIIFPGYNNDWIAELHSIIRVIIKTMELDLCY